MPWGYMTATAVLNMTDKAMELMASVNLIAILLLSGTIAKLTEDYVEKKEDYKPYFDLEGGKRSAPATRNYRLRHAQSTRRSFSYAAPN